MKHVDYISEFAKILVLSSKKNSPQKSDTPGYLMAAPALLLETTDDLCLRGLETCILQKLRHQTWATTRVW